MSMTAGKTIVVLASAFVLTALIANNLVPAEACQGESDSPLKCTVVRFPTPTSTPRPTPTPIPLGGDDPSRALDISNSWATIDPGTSIWFKTDYGDSFRVIELWVDTPTQNALTLAIYAPDQMDGWTDANAVGRGTHNSGEPGHAMTWKADYAKAGIWYARLTNNSSSPAPYLLGGNVNTAQIRKCQGYWEGIKGHPVYWIDCGHYTKIPGN